MFCQTLQERLKHRNTENQHEMITRLEHSKKELELAKSMQFDCVLLNNDFEQCFVALQKSIQTFYAPHSTILLKQDILRETYMKDTKAL
jgi:guanylate kinase